MSSTNTNGNSQQLETASLEDLLGTEWRVQLGEELSELAAARANSATTAKKTFM